MKFYTQRIFVRRTFAAVLVVFAFVFTSCGNTNPTPTTEDFDIGSLSQIKDSIGPITITPKNGTPGTYTTTAPVNGDSVWTLVN